MNASQRIYLINKFHLKQLPNNHSPQIVQNSVDVTPKHFGNFRFDFDINDTVASEGISLWGLPGERRSTISTIQEDLHKSSLSFTRRISTIDMDTMCNEV